MTAAPGEGSPQVEELLRVNADLAAELRALRSGRIGAPRQGRVPAARGIAKLWGERKALETRLEETQAALEASRAGQEATQAALEDVQAHRQGLERQNRDGRPNFRAWLQGKIAYVCMVRPELGARLKAEFQAVR